MKTKARKHRRKGKIGTILLIAAMCAMIGSYFTLTASAETVYTITDGQSSVDVSSKSTDVNTVLSQAGITLKDNDLVTVTGGSSKTYVMIQRSQDVTIQYGDENISAATYGSTVGDLLGELDIPLDPGSTVTSNGCPVSVAQSTYDGMVLEIGTTTTETRPELVSVPFSTVTYQDPTLEAGTTKLQTQGVDGTNQLIYEEVYSNGELVSSTLTGTKVMTEPVDEVILVGCMETPAEEEIPLEIYEEPEPEPEPEPEYTYTSEPEYVPDYSYIPETEYVPEPEYSAPSYYGNTITTSTGEVITYSYSMSVTATAYTGGGTTATGTPARYGAIAVDPSVIPYGTRMYIVSDDGQYIYGYATAEDCGGAVKGNIIDLYFDSYNTCIQFGRRSCTVYFLD